MCPESSVCALRSCWVTPPHSQCHHSIPSCASILAAIPSYRVPPRGTTNEVQPCHHGVSAWCCLYDMPCPPVTSYHRQSRRARSYHYFIPFHVFHFTLSIPVTCLNPVRRVRGLGEPLVRVHTLRSCVVIPQRTQCHHSIPFHLTFHSIPCCPSTQTLLSARILALVEDSLDSADGLSAEFTPDSFRRIVAFHPPPGRPG